MARLLLAMMFSGLPLVALSADDPRVSFLEQEVRNLQRQVLVLTRQVDELRTRPPRVERGKPSMPAAPVTDPGAWLDVTKWQKLREGMSELEVIASLGPPTSMREENGARVLLYAMEIGASGFLGGSVTFRDRAVVEVRKPTLQ
jgi:hypothetical protein